MEVQEYLEIIKKRFRLIVILTLLMTLVTGLLSYFVITPTYASDISVVVGRTQENQRSNSQLDINDLTMYDKLVKTYSVLLTTRTVAQDIIDKLSLNLKTDDLIKMISVTPETDTEFLKITVKSKDPVQARDIANQAAKSLKEVGNNVEKADNIEIVDSAELPIRPASPKPILNMAVAFVIGIMISTGLAFLFEYLDTTVKTQDEIKKLTGLPVIGTIPLIEDEK